MARPRCTPTTHTNALTDAPRSPGSMPSGYKMGSRKKVGWREGLELTGSGIRGAGDASGAAKVRKSQTPSPSPSPGSPACSLGRLPSSGARGGEKSQSRASPGLPSPAWPRAWNPAPLQPRLGETARQGATCQKTLGEQEGRTGAFCTLRLLISSSVDTPPGSPLPRHYTHTHAFALPTIPGPSIKTLVEFFLIKKKKKKVQQLFSGVARAKKVRLRASFYSFLGVKISGGPQ